MRRLVLLFLVACGSDADPHAPATCMGWTDNLGNPYAGTCEAACTKPPPSSGDTCDTDEQLNCGKFSFDDQDGCCIESGGTIKFFECVP